MPAEQWANSSAIYSSKIKLVLRSKALPMNDLKTQTPSSVQYNNDATKQSLSFILSVKVCSH